MSTIAHQLTLKGFVTSLLSLIRKSFVFLFDSVVGFLRIFLNLPKMFASVSFSTWLLLGVATVFFLKMEAWNNEIANINVAGLPGGATIGQLLIVYAALYLSTLYAVWNTFLMRIEAKVNTSALTDAEVKVYSASGFVMLVRYILFTIGYNQDSLWHFAYGTPPEGDFWWLPHILMYVSFLLGAIPLYYWAKAGFSRPWARRHWPIVLAGCTNVYFVFSGGLDVNWHTALGPLGFDFNTFSAAHFPIFICQNVGLAATIAIFTKAFGLTTKVRLIGIVLGVFGLNLLLTGTAVQGEWFTPEPGDKFWWVRPAWSWSVIMLVVGLGLLLFVQRCLKFAGAATITVLGALAMYAFLMFAARELGLTPEELPMKNAVLPVYLGGALVMDFLYWRGVSNPISLAAAFTIAYWVLAIPIYSALAVGPIVTGTDIVIAIVLTVIFVLLYVKSLATSADKIANANIPDLTTA